MHPRKACEGWMGELKKSKQWQPIAHASGREEEKKLDGERRCDCAAQVHQIQDDHKSEDQYSNNI